MNLGTDSFRAPTADDVDDLIEQADLDGDGKINCVDAGALTADSLNRPYSWLTSSAIRVLV